MLFIVEKLYNLFFLLVLLNSVYIHITVVNWDFFYLFFNFLSGSGQNVDFLIWFIEYWETFSYLGPVWTQTFLQQNLKPLEIEPGSLLRNNSVWFWLIKQNRAIILIKKRIPCNVYVGKITIHGFTFTERKTAFFYRLLKSLEHMPLDSPRK